MINSKVLELIDYVFMHRSTITEYVSESRNHDLIEGLEPTSYARKAAVKLANSVVERANSDRKISFFKRWCIKDEEED